MSTKTEEIGVNAVCSLIDLSNYMSNSEIKKGDRDVSFDGHIVIYTDVKQKKSSFKSKIDVQIKAKTVKNVTNNKTCSFSFSKEDILNYKKMGGVILFVVHVSEDKKNKNIFVKSLLPYEINMLIEDKPGNKSYTIRLNRISESNIIDFDNLCIQFISDKQKQFSYINDKKTINDFINKKGSFKLNLNKSFLDNPTSCLDRNYYMYFNPVDYQGVEIPCGILNVSAISQTSKYKITINNYTTEAFVELIYSKNIKQNIVINEMIRFDLEQNKLSLNLKGKLSVFKQNIEILHEFFEFKALKIGDVTISFESFNGLIDLEILDCLINKLTFILDYFSVSSEPTIDLDDEKSLKNIDMIYNNIFNHVAIPFNRKEESIIFITQVFDISLLLCADKSIDDGKYNLIDLMKALLKKEDMFKITHEDSGHELIIYPNFSIFQPAFNLSGKFLCCTNVLNNINKFDFSVDRISNNKELIDIMIWFLLDSILYYDSNKCDEFLLFLEKISQKMVSITSCSDICLINYCQVIKRKSQQLSKKYKDELLSIKDTTNDILMKTAVCILLDSYDEFNFYYEKMNEMQKKSFNEFPIINLINKRN